MCQFEWQRTLRNLIIHKQDCVCARASVCKYTVQARKFICIHDTQRVKRMQRGIWVVVVRVYDSIGLSDDSDNDNDDEDGGDSLLMVYALEKNETCNITNKTTNEKVTS